MTWRPSPQPECEPGCTCGLPTDPDAWQLPVVIRDEPVLRECGVTGCTHCREITRFWASDPDPVPGGGDRLPNSTYNRKATT